MIPYYILGGRAPLRGSGRPLRENYTENTLPVKKSPMPRNRAMPSNNIAMAVRILAGQAALRKLDRV